MTQPDYPDYVPASIPIASSKVLQAMSGVLTTDILSATYDCSRFSTVNIALTALGAAPIKQVSMTVIWFTSGQIVASDSYSVYNGGPNATASGGALFQLPCKGDQVQLQFTSDAAHCDFQFSITATTRVLPAVSISTFTNQDALMSAWARNLSLGAGATFTTYAGPFANGFWVHMTASGTAAITVFAWTLDSGNWVLPVVGRLFTTAAVPDDQLFVNVPGRVIRVDITNTSAAALPVTFSVSRTD